METSTGTIIDTIDVALTCTNEPSSEVHDDSIDLPVSATTTNESLQLLVDVDNNNNKETTVPNIDADGNESNDQLKPETLLLSKKQLRKRKRFEKKMVIKMRRKEQEKEIKIAKAKAAGRDLDAERKRQEQQRVLGINKKQREREWVETKLKKAIHDSFQVCIDCSFQSSMTSKEINSLAIQIRYCYAYNKRNVHPCLLTVTSLFGETLQHLQKVDGFTEWKNRAFDYASNSLEIHYKPEQLHNIVYLTSDSNNIINELDNTKIYVIGGIVDRNRLKHATINRAQQLNVQTAKLPIDTYLAKMESTRVLTCNHVFEILLQYRCNGRNWEKAFLSVLPNRKDAKAKVLSTTTTTDTTESTIE